MSDQRRAHLDASQGAKAAHPSGRPDPVVSHRTTGSHDTAKNLEMQNPVFRTPKVDEYPTLRIMKAYQKFGKQFIDMLRRVPNHSKQLQRLCDMANDDLSYLLPDFPG